MLCGAVAAFLLVVAVPGKSAATRSGDPARRAPLGCLDPVGIKAIRADVGLVRSAYVKCRAELKLRLGTAFAGLPEGHLQAAFAAIVAHVLAPYGSSSAFALGDLLKAPRLDCDNYAALAGHLVQQLPSARAGRLRFVGFDNGPIGNHAQVFYRSDGREILLDPTIGVIARASDAQLRQGKSVEPAMVADFYYHGDPLIAQFKDRVTAALVAGDYRVNERIYVAEGFANFARFGRACARGESGKRFLSYSSPQLPELCRRAAAAPDGKP